MNHFLTFLLVSIQFVGFSQLLDNFSDGDFTSNPTWSGTDADYTVNGSFQLQLDNTIASISYLSTPHVLSDLNNKEWRIWTRQAFSPSGSNFGRIYLTSSSADLTTDPDGFYLQLGEAGSSDAVRLFKVESGTDTELIAGTAGQIASSFSIGIRVVRDNLGNWSLYVDPAGGENYALEGTANDATNLLGTHFGMIGTYTMSNANDFYYDSIYVGNEIIDTDPPVLVSATAVNANQIDVLFDEALDQTSAETVGNYSFSPALGITSVTQSGGNPALITIVPSTPLSNGQTYTLTTDQIADQNSNVSGQQSTDFAYLVAELPAPGDVIINEFMCDPSPVVGLPEVEFVELHNVSSKILNLDQWKLSDASSDGTISNAWLQPGDYIVLTSTSDVDSFPLATSVTSFQSLNNPGDNIVLRDSSGVVIDSLQYTDDWYVDPSKENGGYTIERINPNDPCSDQSNWRASDDALGGTPGTQNSVYDITPDTSNPGIEQLVALAPNFLEIHYTEGMDSTSLADAVITTSPSLTVQNNYVLSTYPDMHILEFAENLAGSQVYSIELQNVGDCWMNTVTLTGIFALPEDPSAGDVVINEILFNPVTGGSDWVEIYNASDKLIDLQNWELANYDDTIANNKIISGHFMLYPDSYAVVGEDTTQILQYYASAVPGTMIEMDLPSYSNDSGTVYLIYNSSVMDRVSYEDDWHFRLLDSDDGVSLERIDPAAPSNDLNNWHSAAEAVGFGTPGMKNSQFYPAMANGEFSYTSETVSPDSDGFEDVLQVNYEMTGPGFVGNFTIYDDRGRLIAKVLQSELLGTEGTFIWDGVKDDNTKATIGTYIGVFEAFDINGGMVFGKRKAFVVAGKL